MGGAKEGLTDKQLTKMDLKKEFLSDCGVDLTDFEYAGKFPRYNTKKGRWGNIPRGLGYKMYAEWLEKRVTSALAPVIGCCSTD